MKSFWKSFSRFAKLAKREEIKIENIYRVSNLAWRYIMTTPALENLTLTYPNSEIVRFWFLPKFRAYKAT